MINFKRFGSDFNEYVVINGLDGKILHAHEKQTNLNYIPANIVSIATPNEHSDVFIYPAMIKGTVLLKMKPFMIDFSFIG